MGCVIVHPVVNKAGWKHYTLVALDPAAWRSGLLMLKGMGRLEIVRKRVLRRPLFESTFLVNVDSFLDSLTLLQAQALSDAIAMGYYQVPRATSFADVAQASGQARTTFEEHVRKAEAKIVHAVAPYLAARINSRAEPTHE